MTLSDIILKVTFLITINVENSCLIFLWKLWYLFQGSWMNVQKNRIYSIWERNLLTEDWAEQQSCGLFHFYIYKTL